MRDTITIEAFIIHEVADNYCQSKIETEARYVHYRIEVKSAVETAYLKRRNPPVCLNGLFAQYGNKNST
jgi:hypothetical protein